MNEKQSDNRKKIAEQFIQALPHSRALGMHVADIGPGTVQLEMDYDERFIGDPETGVISGGAVSAFMDTCCGAAVMSHPDSPDATFTIDLRIDYMRGATPGQKIRAFAECYRMTRTVAFVRATTYDDDTDRPVAQATGAFTAERSS